MRLCWRRSISKIKGVIKADESGSAFRKMIDSDTPEEFRAFLSFPCFLFIFAVRVKTVASSDAETSEVTTSDG